MENRHLEWVVHVSPQDERPSQYTRVKVFRTPDEGVKITFGTFKGRRTVEALRSVGKMLTERAEEYAAVLKELKIHAE